MKRKTEFVPSRREFLRRGAGLTFCFSLTGLYACDREEQTAAQPNGASSFDPNAWVNIAPSGVITIMAPADELGQGSMTALPLILAEELDANWDDVVIEMSPSSDAIYGNPEFGGLMYTASSTAVEGYFGRLRIYGAQARRVLLISAAKHWNVDAEELATEPSVVMHPGRGLRLAYGEIAAFAELPQTLPEIGPEDLKPPGQFRLIGQSVPRRDLPSKVNGQCMYSGDVKLPGLVYAAVARAPIRGARVVAVNAAAARRVPGVTDVLQREDSVVVAATRSSSAQAAREKLIIEWSAVGEVDDYDSEAALAGQQALASDLDRPGEEWERRGEIDFLEQAGRGMLAASYQTDYVYHAQMETLNATAWVQDEGRRIEAWVGTQAPTQTIRAISRVTGLDAERVTLHRSLLGGAFGRRSVQEMDYVVDAAWLSQQLMRPVRLCWSRRDDMAWGWFKPMTAQYLRAALDESANITSWHHRIAVQEPLTTAEPVIYENIGRRPVVSMRGAEQPVYDLPNRLAEHLPVEPGIRTYPLMGVGLTPNKFAIESFIDEIAASAGTDPLEFRLRLTAGSERATRVLNTLAEMCSWGRPRPAEDREMGLCFVDYHGSLLAGAAEISLDRSRGGIRVHEFWAVIDPGIAVQPENIRAQLEGAIVFGLGNALSESITIRNGVVQQSNFDDYALMTMRDTPPIHVEIRPGGTEPTAVGQTGAVLVAPAIGNAFARLTGKRLRRMPFLPGRVTAALAS
jgi:isoquinoline 1-oxidoreductase beta subunit